MIVTFLYQNCAKINFDDTGTTAGVTPASAPADLTGEAVVGSTRKLSFSPTSSIDKATPFKMLFVIDNSSSMKNSMAKLQAATQTVLDKIKNRALEIKVINTSHVKDRSAAAVNSFQQTVEFWLQGDAVGSKVKTLSYGEFSSFPRFKLSDSIFRLSAAHWHKISAEQSSSAEQINSLVARVKQSIEAMGTNGTSRENGLCNFLLALYDDGPNQFFKKGDYGAAVIISDENDDSVLPMTSGYYNSGCFNDELEDSNFERQDLIYFPFRYYIVSGTLSYDGLDADGQAARITENIYMHMPRSIRNRELGRTCDAELENAVRATYVSGRKPYNNLTINSCTLGWGYGDYWLTNYNVAAREANLCTSPMVMNGVRYGNIYEASESTSSGFYGTIVPGSCSKSFKEFGGFRYSNFIRGAMDPEVTEKKDINKAIQNRVNEMFGQSGFYLLNIIQNSTCPATAGSSEGTRYQNLSQLLGVQSESVPICADDYSTSLDKISNAFKRVIEKSYTIEKRPSEVIKSISLERNGSVLVLSSDQYSVLENRIDFKVDLNSSDIVRIELEVQ